MKRELILDIIMILITFVISVLVTYFSYLGFPIIVRFSPLLLIVFQIVITLYKRRLETKRIERQKIIGKAMKLQPLFVKLGRLRSISNFASSLTYRGIMFIEKEIEYSGWRKYFEKYGKTLNERFDSFLSEFNYFIDETERQENGEFSRILNSFYSLVSGFRHLYDDLAKMVELAGKRPPIDEIKYLEEIEENYEDFFHALKQMCDEVKELGEVFRGKYPLVTPLEKISTIHLPR